MASHQLSLRKSNSMNWSKSLLLTTVLATAATAMAHGDDEHVKKTGPIKREQKNWGIAGDAPAAKRTVEISMSDSMRFKPDRIEVRKGETVKFVVRNSGKVMHEFVIGTKRENDEHAALMARFPNMEHDEPYMAHVAPGKTGEIVWTFNKAGEFDFACLIAGHYQAGMVGKIVVATAATDGDAHGKLKR